jgi:hypothetical protein
MNVVAARSFGVQASAVAVLIAGQCLAGCASSNSSSPSSDLPRPLARAFDRLERQGFSVEADVIGPSHLGAVVIDQGSPKTVLVLAAPRGRSGSSIGIPNLLRSFGPVGSDAKATLSRSCGRFVAVGTDHTAVARSLRASGVCNGASPSGP